MSEFTITFTSQMAIFSIVAIIALRQFYGAGTSFIASKIDNRLPKSWTPKTKVNFGFIIISIAAFYLTKSLVFLFFILVIFLINRRKQVFQKIKH